MAVTVIHDTTIVTADDAGALHHDAALVVDGARIEAIGPTPATLARFPAAERVDGRGRAILPGLANTHTHLSRVLARGIYEDLSPPHTPPFTGGLAPLPTPALAPEEERVMVLLGALEAIRSGTTLVLEEGARIDAYAAALADTGLRLLLCERAWDRARASIGQPGEVAAVQEQRGVRPTEYLAREGFLSGRVIAAHCRCMTAEEERVLGAAGAAVAFNAAIAARRGLSPRIDELERAGCLVTLGTDNMAEDMVEVMRTALFMERVRRQDGRRPTPEDVLTWATRDGYRALGVPDGGWLAPGNRADLIMLDLRRPHLTPVLRVVSDLVHNAQAGDVESVMVDGRCIMHDRRVLTLDEPALVAEAERIARAAWSRLFAERPELPRPSGLDLGPARKARGDG